MKVKDIKIYDYFKKTHPNELKLQHKKNYLIKNGDYESPIIINKENYLIDGYITYILSHFYNITPEVYKKYGKKYKKIEIEF